MTLRLKRILGGLQAACLWLAIAATLLLLGVVAFNIIARAVFDFTGGAVNAMIPGAIETSQYALMVAVFAAIPAMLGSGLIRVDLLSRSFPAWLGRLFDRLWLIAMALFALVLADAFFGFALTAMARGDETQDIGIPLWPFYAVAAVECAALAILSAGAVFGLVASMPRDNG